MGYYKAGDEYVYVPFDNIQGEKTNKDGSFTFKLLGGKYHDHKIRMYAPYDVMWFPCGTTYELTPPLNMKKSNKWKMVHNPQVLYGIPVAREEDVKGLIGHGGVERFDVV